MRSVKLIQINLDAAKVKVYCPKGQQLSVKTYRQVLNCLWVVAMLLNIEQFANAQCDIQIVSAGPCLLDSTYGIPHVGDDAYAVKAVVNVIGAPTHPFRFRMTLANNTNYSGYISLTNWYGAWWWYVVPMALDDPIPWSITFDPDGVSGDTNLVNNSASGTFTPIPPSTAVELYSPRLMQGGQICTLNFQPGSGTIPNFMVVFGYPTSHGAQTVISVNQPTNAQYITTSPNGVPILAIVRNNVSAATFQDTNSFTVQLNRIRVNPTLLRTATWADLNALTTNWTQWLASDQVCESTSSQITNFIQLSLPANYRTTMTPYDTARTLHQAVMKKLTYLATPLFSDAVGVLQDGHAECGGFAALLTACLRNVGIPARPISGNREGVGYLGHIRVEFHLPGVEWLVADPTDGNGADPTGTYAYYFGYVPNADSYFATDIGDNHVTPSNFSAPFNNFYFPQIGTGPNWWWNSGSVIFNSYTDLNYLQGVPALWPSNGTNRFFNLYMSDVTNQGSVVIETSTNLSAWSPVATNPAIGNPLSYSFSTTNKPRGFFRAKMIP